MRLRNCWRHCCGTGLRPDGLRRVCHVYKSQSMWINFKDLMSRRHGKEVRIGVLVAIPRCPYFRLVTSTIYPEPSHFWFAQVPFYAYPDVRKCFWVGWVCSLLPLKWCFNDETRNSPFYWVDGYFICSFYNKSTYSFITMIYIGENLQKKNISFFMFFPIRKIGVL